MTLIQALVRNVGTFASRGYKRDGGSPSEIGMQVQISNHLKLLWSKATVVSIDCATKLQRRWREALRSRPAGGGFKPPQAAVGKSHGSERWGKGARDASGVNQEGEH